MKLKNACTAAICTLRPTDPEARGMESALARQTLIYLALLAALLAVIVRAERLQAADTDASGDNIPKLRGGERIVAASGEVGSGMFPKTLKLPGGHLIAIIRGGQSAKARQANIDAFQADQKRIMVCNIAAGGVGVSLHDLNGKHPRVSLICPTWSAIQMIQSFGRIWRQGGLSKSIQTVVYAAETIESRICDRVRSKLNNLTSLVDGDVDAGQFRF